MENKSKTTTLMIILIPIIVILILASSVIAIFNGVIDIITETCKGLLSFLNDPFGWFQNQLQNIWNSFVSITPGDRKYCKL